MFDINKVVPFAHTADSRRQPRRQPWQQPLRLLAKPTQNVFIHKLVALGHQAFAGFLANEVVNVTFSRRGPSPKS